MANASPKKVDVRITRVQALGYDHIIGYKTNEQQLMAAAGMTPPSDGANTVWQKDTSIVYFTVQFKDSTGKLATTGVYTNKVNMGVNLDAIVSAALEGSDDYSFDPSLTGYMCYVTNAPGFVGLSATEIEVDYGSMRVFDGNRTASKTSTNTVSWNGDYKVQYDYKPVFEDKDQWIKGKVTTVIDGDTVRIDVSSKANINVGDPVTIRLVGLNCPETKKDEGDWYDRNLQWAAEHGLEPPTDDNDIMDRICKLADEGKVFMTKLLLNQNVIVVPEEGDNIDPYGRVVGLIYLDIDSGDTMTGSDLVICANTSIIANDSKAFPGQFALADPTYKWSMAKDGTMKSKFPIQSWWMYTPNYETKLTELEKKKQEKATSKTGKEAFMSRYGLVEIYDDQSLDNKIQVGYNKDYKVIVDTKNYTVKKGDTIQKAAQSLGVSADELAIQNSLPPPSSEPRMYSDSYWKSMGVKSNPVWHEGLKLTFNTYETHNDTDEGLYEGDKLNNYNDVPADSQYEDYENMVVDDRDVMDKDIGFDPYNQFHLRIGDCTFLVPPLSIRFDTQASNRRVQTLRSKSSMQTQTGHSSTVVTVDLFFPNLKSVNGYETKGPNGTKYYRNGLRPLIAQFKKAPFLPVENELINERLKIYSVVLQDLEITTVPGFPGCLQARLVMLEFDHTTYMPQEEDFASAFCWPLFRWFYQKSMQKQSDPARTYLKKVDKLDNTITFKIPDESALNERRQAIYDLFDKISPTVFNSANKKDGTTMAEMMREGDELTRAQEQYAAFKEVAYDPDTMSDLPLMYNSKGIFDLSGFNLDDIKGDKNEKLRAKYYEALMKIVSYTYFDGVEPSGAVTMYFVINSAEKLFDVLETLSNEFGDRGDVEAFLGVSSIHLTTQAHSREVRAYTNEDEWSLSALGDWFTKEGRLESQTITAALKKTYGTDLWSGGGIFVIEVKSSNRQKLKKKIDLSDWLLDGAPGFYGIDPNDTALIQVLQKTGEATELSFIDYEAEFEDLNFKAHMSEADVPEVDFPINDIYIQSMTASMHNMYAPLQLTSRESPTYQHLGSSDIAMDIVIKTKSREAIERFRQLMSTTQRLAREYRIAITSGVISIDTAMTALFGVRSILIERLVVETSQEDKESFLVTISLIAFDKTQRASEDLKMTSAFGGTQEEAENAFYAYSARRRNQSGFEYALIDFTLRDLEVYPDLELPTFDELNEDLPYLKITYPNGVKFDHYPNPDNAKFVDPDFYIRCEHTFRDYIYAALEDGQIPVYKKDRLGFEGFEMSPSADAQKNGGMTAPDVQYSDETTQWIKDHLSEIYVGEKSEGSAGWGLIQGDNAVKTNAFDPKTVDVKEATDVRKATVGYMAPDVPKHIQARITQESVSEPPTDDELMRWYELDKNTPKSALDEVRANLKDPTAAEFTKHLTSIICNPTNGFFKDLPSDGELIKAGETDIDTYKYGKTRVSAPKVTMEKVVNVLKALYEHEHSWKQFNSDGSVCWSKTNDIGIGQLNAYTSGILQNLDMARRAAWDWKFNLYKGVEFFAQQYNYCINYADQLGNHDGAVNPLDWAIVCYNKGPKSGLVNYSQPQEVDYYNTIMKIFMNKYGADPVYSSASPGALYNPDIANDQVAPTIKLQKMREKVDIPWNELTDLRIGEYLEHMDISIENLFADIFGENPVKESNTKDDKKIANYDEYRKYCREVEGTFVLDPYREIQIYDDLSKPISSKDPWWNMYYTVTLKVALESYIVDDARGKLKDKDKQFVVIMKGSGTYLYSAYAKALQDVHADKMNAADLSNVFHEKISIEKMFKVMNADDFNSAAEVANTIEVQQATEKGLVAPDDIAILYRSCFKDMLEYDHRGRLLRAFPTYQMFIIDEGRWMAWHKLWDNFYGYNAITSIDLCRDRRIAADTAVISMTNIYHNLSTYDNETSYGEWDYTLGDLIWGTGSLLGDGTRSKVWKTIWDLPDSDILAARRDELNTMMLKPGARIHLRLGYGANALRLPVVFNGTLTEMNTGEVVTIMAQGDGVELCNKLRVSPGDTNMDGILFKSIVEPRDYMCQMFTSKGEGTMAWLQNMANAVVGDIFVNPNPLGIVHFGVSAIPAATLLKKLNFFNAFEDYGECGQNIYCSAGMNTMSQWVYTQGTKEGQYIGYKWNWSDLGSVGQGGDEPNVKISLFDQTPWSVMQAFAHSCPDYIATVLPFEFRSTAFYGKPWWGVIDRYKYKYYYDTAHDMFVREPYTTERKALSQMRIYNDYFDIIGNNITATEEFMYTNVIGIWDKGKKTTRVIQADSDINPDKQTTAIVTLINESDIWFEDHWTQARYAEIAATAALRDYMKDMYQGELIVMGDPTVKPYDRMHIQDNHIDMSGMAEVKRVVHHFSLETGFITTISPDCISVIDDRQGISLTTWLASLAISVSSFQIGLLAKNIMWRKMWTSPAAAMFRKWGAKASNKLFTQVIGKLAGAGPEDMKTLEAISDAIVDYFKNTIGPDGVKRSLNSKLIKKELSEIMRKNKAYRAVDDKVLTKASEIFKSARDTVMTKGGVEQAIDDFWDARKILKGERLAEKSGFAARTASKLWGGVSNLAKFGLKAGGETTAAAIRGTSTLLAKAGAAVSSGGMSIVIEIAIEIGLTILTSALIEEYGRYLKSRQALVVLPLKYRGGEFTAGINGHKGLVAGEDCSAWDKFLMGTGFGSDFVNATYGFLGIEAPKYSTNEEDVVDKELGG